MIIILTSKKNENDKIAIPYGTDLTNLETRLSTLESGSGSGSNNKPTFFQSIIDNTVVYNTNNVLYSLIMSDMQFQSPIKMHVGDNVYPKTTHTLLTANYTSYIDSGSPTIFNTTRKPFVQFFCKNESYPAIEIIVIKSTVYKLEILIYNSDNSGFYKEYVVTASSPKVVIDLTADLAVTRPEGDIKSTQFKLTDLGGDQNVFYQYCVNILSNIFISYTYED
jgi:hypothetical protein